MKKSTEILLLIGLNLILIILIATVIYLSNRGMTRTTTKQEDAIDMHKISYNRVVTTYIKNNQSIVSGSNVKSMIEEIRRQNEEYACAKGKFISIEVKGYEGEGGKRRNLEDDVYKIANYTRGEELRDKCKAANLCDGGENTEKNVKEAGNEMDELRRRIKSGDKYKVTVDTDEDVIIRVHIGLVKE